MHLAGGKYKVKILEDGIEFVEGEHTAKLHLDQMTQ